MWQLCEVFQPLKALGIMNGWLNSCFSSYTIISTLLWGVTTLNISISRLSNWKTCDTSPLNSRKLNYSLYLIILKQNANYPFYALHARVSQVLQQPSYPDTQVVHIIPSPWCMFPFSSSLETCWMAMYMNLMLHLVDMAYVRLKCKLTLARTLLCGKNLSSEKA